MRAITCETIAVTVERLCIEAATILPPALGILLECAAESEASPAAISALEDMVENFKQAAERAVPICEETGAVIVFADIGQDVHIIGGLFEATVNEGIRRACGRGFLGKSIVEYPLRHKDAGDCIPCALHVRLVSGDKLTLHVSLKGFVGENVSVMQIFSPKDTMEAIEDFIVETVSRARADICPPVFLGVGLGGTVAQCAMIAERALLRNADTRNADAFYAQMERRVLEKINKLGIGPMNLGGIYTAIAVNIETYPTHMSGGLPCVVNISGHATRHARFVL
ncbi:MAG: fumarate hydratase [Oscillospiraceae bacterium]|nr:fumarate hydratase [Oscillospiraceae bacterium]